MIVKYTQEEYDKAKSTDKLPLQCEHCGEIFYAEKKLIKHTLVHNTGRLKYCSLKCLALDKEKRVNVKCSQCGKELIIPQSKYNSSKTKHFFCNNSCSAKFNNKLRDIISEEQKEKIRQSLKKHYKEKYSTSRKILDINNKRKYEERKCKVCGKIYTLEESGSTRTLCSRECLEEYRTNRKKYLSEETIEKLRKAGKKSAETQAEIRRSKNEKYFCELCEKHFKDVKHNIPMFNGWDADVIIEDIKYAVLWNGKWHYEQIKENHSVKQVQNRDNIKIKEIVKSGYTPYIIRDLGKYKPTFVEEEFKKFIDTIKDC